MPKYESERIGREIETALSIKHISQKELADKADLAGYEVQTKKEGA